MIQNHRHDDLMLRRWIVLVIDTHGFLANFGVVLTQIATKVCKFAHLDITTIYQHFEQFYKFDIHM